MIKKERLEGMMERAKGFTLIEILIVVAIIAILASIVLIGLGPAQQSARDARRVADLHQVQNVLQEYYNMCGYYPGTATGVPCGGFFPVANYSAMSAEMQKAGFATNGLPVDPSGGTAAVPKYNYAAANAGTGYILEATLENKNGTVFNSYNPPNPANYPNGNSGISCVSPSYCTSI